MSGAHSFFTTGDRRAAVARAVLMLPAFVGLAGTAAAATGPARSTLSVGATVVSSCTVTTGVGRDDAPSAVVSCTDGTAAAVTVERIGESIRTPQPASATAGPQRITITY